MSAHTLIPPDDLASLLSHYDFSAFTEYQILPGDSLHTHYQFTCAEGCYVLTLLEGLSDQRAHRMTACLNALAKQGIPCPCPTQTAAGNLLTHCYQRPVYVYRYLVGNTVGLLTTPDSLRDAGTLLGRIHHCQVHTPLFTFDEKMALHQQRRLQLTNLIDDAQLQALNKEADTNDLPMGICHGDWCARNLLLNDCNQVNACLDFDHVFHGPFIYDIAHALNTLIPQIDNEELNSAFFEGYESIRPIDTTEVKALAPYRLLAASHVLINELNAKYNPKTFYSDNLDHAQIQFDTLNHCV